MATKKAATKRVAGKKAVKKQSAGFVYIDSFAGEAHGPYNDIDAACFEARDHYDDGEDFEVYELVSAGKFCAATEIKFIKA